MERKGISPSTRKKLAEYDQKENELKESFARRVWGHWHGKIPYPDVKEASQRLAALAASTDYRKTLRTAAGEASGHEEKREIDLRVNEALYNAVARDPDVLEERERAAEQTDSFRYEFFGQSLSRGELVHLWNSNSILSPAFSREAYTTYLEQSAHLREPILRVVDRVNEASVRAGQELGLDVKSFADVILRRNELLPIEFKSRMAGLLSAAKDVGTFLDNLKEPFGVDEITPLNDVALVSTFLQNSGYLKVFPQTPSGSFEYLKHILMLCGFEEVHGSEYLDLSSFGDAPHEIDLTLGLEAGFEEGALRLGKGVREYVAGINPHIKADPREYLKALFHECGHLLHYDGMDRIGGDNFYKTDAEAFREGMALTLDALITDPHALEELGEFEPDDFNLIYNTSRFLDTTRMREFAMRSMVELGLYELHPDEVDALYADLTDAFPVSRLDPPIPREIVGRSWGTETMLGIKPGASIEYALGFAITGSVLPNLMAVGEGTAVHEKTAQMLVEYCYTGFKVPWRLRIKQLLEDTGQKEKQVLH